MTLKDKIHLALSKAVRYDAASDADKLVWINEHVTAIKCPHIDDVESPEMFLCGDVRPTSFSYEVVRLRKFLVQFPGEAFLIYCARCPKCGRIFARLPV